MHIILVAAVAAVATARPSFIAVPADQITFVDLSSLHLRRVPRQTLSPPPPPQLPQALYDQDYQPIPLLQQYHHQPANLAPQPEPQRVVSLQQQQQPRARDPAGSASLRASARLAERPPDFGEYVDFGAHTGDAGAFGWYADYPINNHEDSSGYRK